MAWQLNFAKSIYALHILGVTVPCYAALSSLALNIGVSVALSLVFNAFARGPRADATVAADYA
jgi:hypothetical protein